MIKVRSKVSTIALAIATLCFSAVPSLAQFNNSNVGGTNNSNFGGTNNSNFNGFSGTGPGSNDAMLQQAKSLQSRLAAAQAAVRASTPQPTTGDGVRRFLRAAGTCDCCNCSGTPEQAELQKVKAEAAAFLAEMKGKGNTAFNPSW